MAEQKSLESHPYHGSHPPSCDHALRNKVTQLADALNLADVEISEIAQDLSNARLKEKLAVDALEEQEEARLSAQSERDYIATNLEEANDQVRLLYAQILDKEANEVLLTKTLESIGVELSSVISDMGKAKHNSATASESKWTITMHQLTRMRKLETKVEKVCCKIRQDEADKQIGLKATNVETSSEATPVEWRGSSPHSKRPNSPSPPQGKFPGKKWSDDHGPLPVEFLGAYTPEALKKGKHLGEIEPGIRAFHPSAHSWSTGDLEIPPAERSFRHHPAPAAVKQKQASDYLDRTVGPAIVIPDLDKKGRRKKKLSAEERLSPMELSQMDTKEEERRRHAIMAISKYR